MLDPMHWIAGLIVFGVLGIFIAIMVCLYCYRRKQEATLKDEYHKFRHKADTYILKLKGNPFKTTGKAHTEPLATDEYYQGTVVGKKQQLDHKPHEASPLRSSITNECLGSKPCIAFNLDYIDNEMLHVVVERVANIPKRFFPNNVIFIRITHIANNGLDQEQWDTAAVDPSDDILFDEEALFDKFEKEVNVKSSLLLFNLFTKDRSSGEDACIGEACYDWKPLAEKEERMQSYVMELSLTPASTNKSGPTEDLGFLFIVMQYQGVDNVINIIIHRADNLPKGSHKQEYFVVTSLEEEGQGLQFLVTKPVAGPRPTWNTSLTFPVKKDINQYSLRFTVLEGENFSEARALGTIALGPNESSSGKTHWQQSIIPLGFPVAKWHEITHTPDIDISHLHSKCTEK